MTPKADAPAGPVMAEWDEILSRVTVPEPPMRDIDGWPAYIRSRNSAGLHELMARSANAEEDETSRLPAPKHLLLTRHDECSLEIEIGDHIDFVVPTKSGCASVAPPARFLTHYLKYGRSNLPVVASVVTMPLVLSDGSLLSQNGLDRARRLLLRIDPALLRFLPDPQDYSEDAIAKAFKFLTDEWLIDVAAGVEGKAVLVAYALSIIERALCPERPLFLVTSGKRGGGKSTAITMATIVALGKKATAAAWSWDEEERRKSVFACLLDGFPAVVWDNIPDGMEIASRVFEQIATEEFHSDRILGVSRQVEAPAYTVMVLTGNNVLPKGALASRTLLMRLNVDRPDPENRALRVLTNHL